MVWAHKMHCNSWASVVLFNLPARQQVNESVQDRLVGLWCRKGLWLWMCKAYRDPRGSILIQEHQDLATWEESVFVYKVHICFSLLFFFLQSHQKDQKLVKMLWRWFTVLQYCRMVSLLMWQQQQQSGCAGLCSLQAHRRRTRGRAAAVPCKQAASYLPV